MQREAWFGEVCRQTVDMLPGRHRAFLEDIPHLHVAAGPYETGLVAKATLLSLICLRYATAYSTNEIAAQLLRSGLHPEDVGPGELLDELIRPVLSAFRRGRIPIDNWWNAGDLMLVVLPCYARWRLAEIEEDVVRRELMERWHLSQGTTEAIIEEARLGEPLVPELLRTPAPDSNLEDLWQRDGMAEALSAEREALSQRPAPNETVAELRDAVARHRAISVRLEDLTQVRPDLRSELALARSAVSEATKNLTVFEAGFIRPRDREDETLRAAVDSMRNIIHISSAGANAPADAYLDGLIVPDWLTEYCVAVGGRMGHRSCGPIPYWFCAFEGSELPDELAGREPSPVVALAIDQKPHGLAEIFRVFHMRGEERFAGFNFADGYPDDAIQLALIALCGFIRFDTFLLGTDGLLELIGSSRVDVADTPVGQHLREAALRALAGQRADQGYVRNAWLQELGEDEGAGGFLASDRAKSEELLGLAVPSAEVPKADEETLAAYREARDHFLALHDERACRSVEVKDVGSFDEAIESQLADYRFAADNLGPRRSDQPQATRLADLVEGIVDAEHAFLHLNRSPEYLDAFLCISTDEGLVAERFDVSTTPLRDVERALHEWEEGEPQSLQRAIATIGTQLGQTVAEALAGYQARHLYISPVGFLHAFPFSQLPTDSGRLGDELSISYAPSARVLQRLRNKPPADAEGRVLAVAYHEDDDIELTSAEVAIAANLYGNALPLDGDDATPQRFLDESRTSWLLHLACHGTWRPGDSYGSGLHLAGPSPAEGYLSMARVHREAELAGVKLAVLSACDSGRATLFWPEVQNYPGIDGAFLARGASIVVSSLWEVMDLAGLLFTTTLQLRLTAGEKVLDAFATGVDTLASGRYLNLHGEPEAAVLDQHAPGWRAAVEEVGDDLTDPYFWSVFKLSGLVRR